VEGGVGEAKPRDTRLRSDTRAMEAMRHQDARPRTGRHQAIVRKRWQTERGRSRWRRTGRTGAREGRGDHEAAAESRGGESVLRWRFRNELEARNGPEPDGIGSPQPPAARSSERHQPVLAGRLERNAGEGGGGTVARRTELAMTAMLARAAREAEGRARTWKVLEQPSSECRAAREEVVSEVAAVSRRGSKWARRWRRTRPVVTSPRNELAAEELARPGWRSRSRPSSRHDAGARTPQLANARQ
jgi:hypothetical protein